MSFKFGKKGKNPGAVDNWLDTLGYYRKNIAYDETCLFRAVSEQLYFSQMYHERIRKECIEYAKDNFDKFADLVKNEMEWYDHLQKLKIHMVVCDNIEIQIISKLYKREVLVFDGIRLRVQDVTNNRYSGTLLLCKTNEDHYDVVYKREYIMTAGFCQSIVYSILYENVFKIENVSAIVNSMLYDKNAFALALNNSEYSSEDGKQTKLQGRCHSDNEGPNELKRDRDIDENDEEKGGRGPLDLLLAPFPFKVAKALDPTIYRNIEYDTWIEVRRELRLGEWYNGDNKLILGTRCILRLNGQDLSCYIQEHIKNEDKCVVYVTSLAEFRTVLYTDLRAEDDAKPWPLPYRFSRNLITYPTPLQLPSKEYRNAKKRKEKKRNKSLSESSTQSGVAVSNTSENVGEVNQMKDEKETLVVDASPPSQMEHTPVQQEPEVQWMNEWGPIAYASDPTMWPQSPNNPQSPHPYSYKPVVPVFTYPEPPQNIQYYYNYPVESYSPWPTPEVMPSDINYIPCENPEEVQTIPDSYSTPPKYYYYHHHHSPAYTNPASPCERAIVTAPMTPTTPQVDYYPVMYPPSPHPGTPIYYIPPPPPTPTVQPKVADLVIPMSPMSVYTPPADVQYMSPASFVFPTPRTPQPAWYPSNVNSQGFVFPTPVSSAPQAVAK
ncbi:protein ovarian tumor locus-like isoform X2 [Agrilus planipennis]|uniref:Protein ovarian tumor locus-like isoform X2 n=1 Tax=Agrilus planipennis TaxID=224129 RepID=A0A1W4X3X4_AGRPL|nr:protein ovarian tumor locus-like isoform X2 [Agrilus planipennis]